MAMFDFVADLMLTIELCRTCGDDGMEHMQKYEMQRNQSFQRFYHIYNGKASWSWRYFFLKEKEKENRKHTIENSFFL